jgi:4-amino-4-deoxy-L-arabinose transferase-like glycosyltransferase
MKRVALIVALSIPLIFIGLGAVALLEPDEPYYAVPAREMLETGTWQVTIFHGQPWFDKPILFYWMILAAYKVLGVSELSTRIGSAFMGLACALVVYLFARRSPLGDRTAFIAALILLTNIEYPLMARSAVTDMTLTALLTLAMLAAARYLESGATRWAALTGAVLGVATLTKGPVGVLLPGVALLAYAALARRRDLFRLRPLAAGAAALVAVAAPWYLYMTVAHRDLLFQTFIGEGNMGRFFHPEHVWFPGYYLAVLAAGLIPWSGGLPAALLSAVWPERWEGERGSGRPTGPLYELCWFGSVLFVFSLSASKLPSYLMPAFPAAALLLARYWTASLAPSSAPSSPPSSALVRLGPRISAWLGVALAAGAVYAALAYGSSQKQQAAGLTAVLIAGVLLLGAVLAVVSVRAGSLGALVAVNATTAVAAVLILILAAIPRIEPLVSTRALVRDLERSGLAAQVVGTYKQSRLFGLDYYLGRTTARATNLEALKAQVAEHPGGIWVLRTAEIDRLAAQSDLAAAAVARGPEYAAVRIAPAATGR